MVINTTLLANNIDLNSTNEILQSINSALVAQATSYSVFFYTSAGILASVFAIVFSIMLSSSERISHRYGTGWLLDKFFFSKTNISIFILYSLGILFSLFCAIMLKDNWYALWFIFIWIFVCLTSIFYLFKEFSKFSNPLLQVDDLLKEILINDRKGKKKNKNLREDNFRKIKDLINGSSEKDIKRIINKINNSIQKYDDIVDKDYFVSKIKTIGILLAKKSSELSLYSIEKLMRIGEIFVKDEDDDFASENCICWSRGIIQELEKYKINDVSYIQWHILFSNIYSFAKKLNEKKKLDILHNLNELFCQIKQYLDDIIINDKTKELINEKYTKHNDEISSWIRRLGRGDETKNKI